MSLSPDTTYYYRVRALKGAAVSTNSNIIEVKTLAGAGQIVAASPPSAPVIVSVFNRQSTIVNLAFIPSANTTDFRIDVSISSVFSSFVGNYNNHIVTYNDCGIVTIDNVNYYFLSLPSLTPAIQYYVRLKGVNAAGQSSWSGTFNFRTNVALQAPTIALPTDVSSTSFIANWTKVPTATSYRLDVSTVSNFSSFVSQDVNVGNVDTYTVTSLSPSTTYYYQVRAVVSSTTSENSGTELLTTLASGTGTGVYITPPAAVAFTNVNILTDTKISISWTPRPYATEYEHQISTLSDFSSNTSTTLQGTTRLTTGLTPGTSYFIRARAKNGSVAGAWSTTYAFSALSVGSITVPTAIAATNINLDTATINWQAVPLILTYSLDVSTENTFTTGLIYNDLSVGAGATAYLLSNLTPNTTYYYRVRAYNFVNISNYSNVISFTTGASLTAPTVNPATAIKSTSFNANWATVVGTTYYLLTIAPTANKSEKIGGGYWFRKNVGNVLTYQATQFIDPNTAYSYRVESVANGAIGDASAWQDLTTLPPTPTIKWVNGFNTLDWGVPGEVNRLQLAYDSNFKNPLPGYENKIISLLVSNYTINEYTQQIFARAYYDGGDYSNVLTTVDTNTIWDSAVGVIALQPGPVFTQSAVARWLAKAGATSYRLQLGTVSGNVFTPNVGWELPREVGNVTSYTIDGLTANTAYAYRASAVNGTTASVYGDYVTFITNNSYVFNGAISAPAASASTGVETDRFIAAWSAISGTGYLIEISRRTDFILLDKVLFSAGLSMLVTGLNASTTYYHRVAAVNGTDRGVYSSTITTATTAITTGYSSVPGAISINPASSTTDGFTVSWVADSQAAGYVVYVSEFSNFSILSDVRILTTGTLSRRVAGAKSATLYYIRVVGFNTLGSGPNSVITFTTS